MSLLFADIPSGQVGLYGTNTAFMLDGVYAGNTGATLVEDPDPNISGNVILTGSSGSAGVEIRKVLPAPLTTVGISLRLWMGQMPTSAFGTPSIQIKDNLNVRIVALLVDPAGFIHVRNSSDLVSGSDLAATSVPVLTAGAWSHIEAKLTIGAGTGAVEIRVNGISVLSATGLALGATQVSQISLASGSNASGQTRLFHWKDLLVWDTAGSVNNTFMGSCSVVELIPNADSSFSWGASSGTTGFNLINEAPPGDDTNYIFAVSPAPAASSFDLTNLPADVTSVRGLVVVGRSKKTDGGDGNLQTGLISGASTGLGADRPITTAYTYWQDVFELDPATGAAWTPVAVDAVKLRVNRTL